MFKKTWLSLILGCLLLVMTGCGGGAGSATFEFCNRGESDVTLKSIAIGGQTLLEQNLTLRPDQTSSSESGACYTTTFTGTGKVSVVVVLHDPDLRGTVTYEGELDLPKNKNFHAKLLYAWGQVVTVTTVE